MLNNFNDSCVLIFHSLLKYHYILSVCAYMIKKLLLFLVFYSARSRNFQFLTIFSFFPGGKKIFIISKIIEILFPLLSFSFAVRCVLLFEGKKISTVAFCTVSKKSPFPSKYVLLRSCLHVSVPSSVSNTALTLEVV